VVEGPAESRRVSIGAHEDVSSRASCGRNVSASVPKQRRHFGLVRSRPMVRSRSKTRGNFPPPRCGGRNGQRAATTSSSRKNDCKKHDVATGSTRPRVPPPARQMPRRARGVAVAGELRLRTANLYACTALTGAPPACSDAVSQGMLPAKYLLFLRHAGAARRILAPFKMRARCEQSRWTAALTQEMSDESGRVIALPQTRRRRCPRTTQPRPGSIVARSRCKP